MSRDGLLRPALWTAATTGSGLLLWTAISAAVLHGRIGTVDVQRLQVSGLGLGLLLSATLLPLLWRTPAPNPWRLRALGLGALSMLAALALLTLKTGSHADPMLISAAAMATAMGGVLTLAATPPALLQPSPPLRMPVQLATAMLAGATLLFALIALAWGAAMPATAPAPSLLMLVLVLAGLLLLFWRDDRRPAPLPAMRPRWIVLGLLAGLPLLLALLSFALPGLGRLLWPLAALSVLAGSTLEHRLLLATPIAR